LCSSLVQIFCHDKIRQGEENVKHDRVLYFRRTVDNREETKCRTSGTGLKLLLSYFLSISLEESSCIKILRCIIASPENTSS
jgi:hypothetical protein